MSATRDQDTASLGIDGFLDGAIYDRGRPGYPPEAIDLLRRTFRIRPGARLLDLGAGTGKLTEELVDLKASVIAIEPSDSMRAELVAKLPTVDALAGLAEKIPVPSSSVDVVIVAQSFHWFDPAQALPEIARVLRRGGGLGLVWNERDESIGWVRELSCAMRWHERQPYEVGMDFRPIVTEGGLFEHPQRRQFRFCQVLSREDLIARIASTSYIAALETEERDWALEPVRELVSQLPEPIGLPYVTDLYTFQALQR
jgi:SAM-dependent methyltransferase